MFNSAETVELYFWNDEIGDMDMYTTDITFDVIPMFYDRIEIYVTEEGEESAIVYSDQKAIDCGYPIVDIYANDLTHVPVLTVNTPIGDKNFAGAYVLYDKKLGIDYISEFIKRESAFDMPVKNLLKEA